MTIVLFRELLTVSLIVAGGSVMLAQGAGGGRWFADGHEGFLVSSSCR